jgi:hypothetical protein
MRIVAVDAVGEAAVEVAAEEIAEEAELDGVRDALRRMADETGEAPADRAFLDGRDGPRDRRELAFRGRDA